MLALSLNFLSDLDKSATTDIAMDYIRSLDKKVFSNGSEYKKENSNYCRVSEFVQQMLRAGERERRDYSKYLLQFVIQLLMIGCFYID